jgi:predicted glycosyl hydrolase (DUF1957 family)
MPRYVYDGSGKKYLAVTEHFVDMGRRKRTKMIVRDVKVQNGKCIISLEIRRGTNVWNKAYGFSQELLKEWDNQKFIARVKADALKLEEDKHFEDRVLMRLEHMVDKLQYLD